MSQARAVGDLYERLIQRLALAIHEAEQARSQAPEDSGELELRGLSLAEMAWIQAYLSQDLQWLRGWHAAAEELALLERQGCEADAPSAVKTTDRPSGDSPVLFCACCGSPVRMSADRAAACPVCTSQVFRAGRRR